MRLTTMTDKQLLAACAKERQKLKVAAAVLDKALAPAKMARRRVDEAMDRYVPLATEASRRGIA